MFTKNQKFYTSRGAAGHDPERLNFRYNYFMEPAKSRLHGARVLDLGSYNGRWAWAALELGASQVLGLDGHLQSVEDAREILAEEGYAGKCNFLHVDFYEHLPTLEPGQFDVILCMGILYHVFDHFTLISECARLQPDLLIVDTAVVNSPDPIAKASREKTDWSMYPSPSLMQIYFERAGLDWQQLEVDMAAARKSRHTRDYAAGERIAYHCTPHQVNGGRFLRSG